MINKDKNEKKTFFERGITLIALVVTIVILIILASVAITMSISNTGIFSRAKTAREEYLTAANEEEFGAVKLVNDINVASDRTTNNASTSRYRVLWEGMETSVKTAATATESLSEEFTHFDMIGILIRYHQKYATQQYTIDTQEIKKLVDKNESYHIIITPHDTHYCYIDFKPDYKGWYMRSRGTSGQPYAITKIVGIKF